MHQQKVVQSIPKQQTGRTEIVDDWTQFGRFIFNRGMVVFTARRNQTFVLNCTASTDHDQMKHLKITWFSKKHNRLMTSCEAAKSGFDEINSLFTCELLIPSVGSDDDDDDDAVYGDGVYTCEAASDLDKVIQSFYLNVQGEWFIVVIIIIIIIICYCY